MGGPRGRNVGPEERYHEQHHSCCEETKRVNGFYRKQQSNYRPRQESSHYRTQDDPAKCQLGASPQHYGGDIRRRCSDGHTDADLAGTGDHGIVHSCKYAERCETECQYREKADQPRLKTPSNLFAG